MARAVIFDMDGVISDTQGMHAHVESEFLAKHGVIISPEELSRRFAGVKDEVQFQELLGDKLSNAEIDDFIADKWKHLIKIASHVEAISGAVELIKRLRAENIPLALASASIRDYVNTILKHLSVYEDFSAIISGDMVVKGKPDPETFLLAAEKLSVPPRDCAVIEDGVAGMDAAISGGMKCIALVENISDELPPVTMKITSFQELNPAIIRNL